MGILYTRLVTYTDRVTGGFIEHLDSSLAGFADWLSLGARGLLGCLRWNHLAGVGPGNVGHSRSCSRPGAVRSIWDRPEHRGVVWDAGWPRSRIDHNQVRLRIETERPGSSGAPHGPLFPCQHDLWWVDFRRRMAGRALARSIDFGRAAIGAAAARGVGIDSSRGY